MSEENGINELWEEVLPKDLPPRDELQNENWLGGDYNNNPTNWVSQHITEAELGNDPTQSSVRHTSRVYGYDNITLANLLQTGWNWSTESITPYSMSTETWNWLQPRIKNKINDRYYFRDLGVSSVARWQHLFKTRLVEILDELGPLYDQVHKGLDILDKGIDQKKSIDVNSEFPQARLLIEQEDYASDSHESKEEATGQVGQLDGILKYQNAYRELDSRVVEHMGQCFSSFINPSTF